MRKRLECQRRSCRLHSAPTAGREYSYPWLSSASREVWTPGGGRDREEKKDLEYWKQLYPAKVRRVQREVEHQCDLLDYSGSMIYDEYPDRMALSRICEAVYQALVQEEARGVLGKDPSGMPAPAGSGSQEDGDMVEELGTDEDFIMPEEEDDTAAPSLSMEAMQYQGDDRSLQDMIEVLLYNEIYRRRCCRRRGRSWYFG